jgi:predicted murein hydrolase (TIGR00659 family)
MTAWITLTERQPLFAVGMTMSAFAASDVLWRKTGKHSFLSPVLVASAVVAGLLVLFGIPYDDYLQQAAPINNALPIVIVLLAVPLSRQFGRIKRVGFPMSLALAVGSFVAIASALALPVAMGASGGLLATLAPKSVTAAVAVELANRLGGVPALTAVIVVSTGIFGAAFGPMILKAGGVRDERAVGLALGIAGNALGVVRAFQMSETVGAFASVGMILNALLTILFVPLFLTAL